MMLSLMHNISSLFSKSLYFRSSPPLPYLPSVTIYLLFSLPLELSYLHSPTNQQRKVTSKSLITLHNQKLRGREKRGFQNSS